MSIKSNIKKILFVSLAVAGGAGLLILLVAAINKKNHKNCTGVSIAVNAKNNLLFLSRQDILNIIVPDKNNSPKGKPLASFNLKEMENRLEQNAWVQGGQLFFDNNGVLRISVEERTPVARIFTVNGNSFYIDSSGKRLPLNSNITTKLPVFSNFPSDKEQLYGADSALMQAIKQISPFILADSFWMAQIGQIDITPGRTFEMIPVIGRHVVVLGNGNDIAQKFHSLFLFYRQVGARVGLDKYSIINVSYKNQVVATKRGVAGKIDSLQALKNIQKMIEASQQLQNDTVSTMVDNNIVLNASPLPTLMILKDSRKNIVVKDSFNKLPVTHPLPLKMAATQPDKTSLSHIITNRQPKAVMKKPKRMYPEP